MDTSKVAIALIALGVGCAASRLAPSSTIVPASAATTTTTHWEYTCFLGGGGVEQSAKELNRLGAQGWELAAGAGGEAAPTWCMKRAVP